jgi:hypothetical protein
MAAQFIVLIYKNNITTGKETIIRSDGPFTEPQEANAYGLREAAKNRGYYNVLPLSPPIPTVEG